MGERVRTVTCTICGKPVRLEECQVNDLGQPVQETCLAERITEDSRKRRNSLEHDSVSEASSRCLGRVTTGYEREQHRRPGGESLRGGASFTELGHRGNLN